MMDRYVIYGSDTAGNLFHGGTEAPFQLFDLHTERMIPLKFGRREDAEFVANEWNQTAAREAQPNVNHPPKYPEPEDDNRAPAVVAWVVGIVLLMIAGLVTQIMVLSYRHYTTLQEIERIEKQIEDIDATIEELAP